MDSNTILLIGCVYLAIFLFGNVNLIYTDMLLLKRARNLICMVYNPNNKFRKFTLHQCNHWCCFRQRIEVIC